MKTWYEMVDEIIDVEGGYSNNPADRGGPTKYGVTESVARANGYQGPMEDMPLDVAKTVYRTKYWQQPRFDAVGEISPVIATELLDTGINMGIAVASKFLQRALNVLNQQGKLWPDLAVDGNIGPATLSSLDAYLKIRGTQGAEVMMKLLNAQQAVRYMEISEANPAQETFLYGWISNRVGAL